MIVFQLTQWFGRMGIVPLWSTRSSSHGHRELSSNCSEDESTFSQSAFLVSAIIHKKRKPFANFPWWKVLSQSLHIFILNKFPLPDYKYIVPFSTSCWALCSRHGWKGWLLREYKQLPISRRCTEKENCMKVNWKWRGYSTGFPIAGSQREWEGYWRAILIHQQSEQHNNFPTLFICTLKEELAGFSPRVLATAAVCCCKWKKKFNRSNFFLYCD